MSESPTIMVIGGGEWQVPLIRKARALGFRVVNTNLYPDSPGFRHADVGEVVDVLDREANLAVARREHPDGIVTDQSDIAVPTVAYLCEELGLPGIGLPTAERFTNKYAMRRFREELGLPNPRFRSCASREELEDFHRVCGRVPLVVKPPASQSSRGVVKVDSPDRFDAAVLGALRFSRDGTVLAEEFIDGPEITVEGLMGHGGHHSLAVSIKEHYEHNTMVARRLLYAWEFPEFDVETLLAEHDRFISATGLSFGITHSEYRVRDGVFYLIEAAARGGGTKVSSHIIPLMSGIDANGALLRMALGGAVEAATPRREQRLTVLQFFEFAPGRVEAVRGLEVARDLPGVVDVELNFRVGDLLETSVDDRTRHMHLICCSDSRAGLEELIERVRQCIQIDYA